MNKAVIDDLKQFISTTMSEKSDIIVEDLKQFVTTTFTQQTAEIRGDIAEIRGDITEIRNDVSKLDTKVEDLTTFVTGAIDTNDELYELRHQNHEQRITKLEA